MPTLEAGKPVEQLAFTPSQLLLEEPWGEVWRGSHATHGRVFLAAYSGPRGEAHFERISARLAQWNRRADVFPGLMHILETHPETAIPCLILRDPGGPTLREKVKSSGPLGPTEASKVAHDIASALYGISNEGIGPIGLSPDNIVARTDYGWMIVPFALLDANQPANTGGGAWMPPGISESKTPDLMNPDIYAMSLLVAGATAGALDAPMAVTEIRLKSRHKRLSLVLSNGVVPRSGNYADARTTSTALERYRKTELQADLLEVEQVAKAATRSPMEQKLHENRAKLILGGKIAGALVGVMLLVLLVVKMFSGGDPTKSPRGLTRVYFEAMIARDGAKASLLTEGEASMQTFRLLEEIKRMEEKHLASRFATADSPRMGDANSSKIQAKTQLRGEGGDPFMQVEFVLEQKPDGSWKIVSLLYESLRKEGQ